MNPMLMVSVSHMAVHDNTSGHLQLAILRHAQLIIVAVLVMLLLRYLYHYLLEETISVSQELTQDTLGAFTQMILCGMARTVLTAVDVVHSTILQISLRDFLAVQQTI